MNIPRYPTLIHERVDLARRGENPAVICRMPSGWAVLGDYQFLTGYSLLLADLVFDHLNDLDDPSRSRFLQDMALLGEARHACTGAFRLNYEILGNCDAALYAHVFPRYHHEPDEYRNASVWSYPAETRTSMHLNAVIHDDLRKRISSYLTSRIGS